MPSRMDKYNETIDTNDVTTTRSQKNEQLYQNIYTNRRYTEIGNIEKDNVVDITDTFGKTPRSSRSDFQRNRVLYEDGFINNYEENIVKGDNHIEIEKTKSYNLNDVLEEARKNRNVETEEEKQRKIKNVEYSILTDLSQEKLRDYKEKKEKPLSKDEEENLEDLIHTITSNSLRKKIDDGLLTDLMPETEEEPVISTDFLESLDLAKEENHDEISVEKEMTLETTLDNSFFTKSMDLKKEDIIQDEEVESMVDESFKEEKMATWKVILIIVLITIVLGLLGYIVLRFV